MPETTRFAPSPTGQLHLGHARAALFAAKAAAGGTFLLRFEDIDTVRSKPAFEEAIVEDLHWLGLTWPTPVRRQSDHFADYTVYLKKLNELDLLYPCFCSRKEIQEEVSRSPAAPHGPEGALYPGTCRHLSLPQRRERIANGESYSLRLDTAKALAHVGGNLTWQDRARGRIVADPLSLGDVVLGRKDVPASYHLCVTVDDHLQGVTLVTRGEDLFHATHIHRLLQAVFQFATPDYHHHSLLLDAQGKRFAKRDRAVTLQSLREAGVTPDDIRRMALPDAVPVVP